MQQRAQIILAEILVAGDLHFGDFVALAGIDLINHAQHILLLVRLSPQVNAGIEIAPRLHVAEKIAAAFVQKIVIQRVLFVNRNMAPHGASTEMKAFGADLNYRTGLNR